MQALVYTANNELTLEDHPIPVPAPGEVLLRVEAAGVCGSDVDGFLGRSRKRRPPLVMGHEMVGSVEASAEGRVGGSAEGRVGGSAEGRVGAAVSRPGAMSTGGSAAGRVGAAVSRPGAEPSPDDLYAVMPLSTCGACSYCADGRSNLCPERRLLGMDAAGAFAQYLAVPADALYPISGKISVAAAVLAEPVANACHVIRLLGGRVPPLPVIIGFGAIGAVVMLALKATGAEGAIAVDTNPLKLERAMQLGAHAAFDARDPELVSLVADAAGQVDLVIDCIGKGASRALGIAVASPSARLVWIGQNDGEMAGEARDITTKELAIQGSYAYTRADFEQGLKMLEQYDAAFSELVSFESLLAGQEVFERLVSDPGSAIKIALVPPQPRDHPT